MLVYFRRYPAMAQILILAFAVRVLIALSFYNIIAPDEIFQTLEPAHRLVLAKVSCPGNFRLGCDHGGSAIARRPDGSGASDFCQSGSGVSCHTDIARHRLVAHGLGGSAMGRGLIRPAGSLDSGALHCLMADLWLMAPHPLEEVLSADIFGARNLPCYHSEEELFPSAGRRCGVSAWCGNDNPYPDRAGDRDCWDRTLSAQLAALAHWIIGRGGTDIIQRYAGLGHLGTTVPQPVA